MYTDQLSGMTPSMSGYTHSMYSITAPYIKYHGSTYMVLEKGDVNGQ